MGQARSSSIIINKRNKNSKGQVVRQLIQLNRIWKTNYICIQRQSNDKFFLSGWGSFLLSTLW